MAFSPQTVGATQIPWGFTLTKDSGAAVDLTGLVGSNLTLVLAGPSRIVGTGVFTINSPATAGSVTYQQTAADVATAGDYQVQVTATFAGPRTIVFDPIDLKLIPPL